MSGVINPDISFLRAVIFVDGGADFDYERGKTGRNTLKFVDAGAFSGFTTHSEQGSSFSCYPVFEPVLQQDGTYLCDVRLPEAYIQAAEHTQAFIDGLAGLSDREKMEQLVWYVADRITYQVAYPGPGQVLTQDEQIPGCCAAYAYNFLFLCNRADIPCLLKVGDNHEWNCVYVDGEWWDVDVTANDCGDETEHREYSTILWDPAMRMGIYDEYPHITAFIQELLAPGSTK